MDVHYHIQDCLNLIHINNYVETDERDVDYEILTTSLDFDETIEPTTLSEPCSSNSTKIEKKKVNRNILKDAGFLKVEQLTPIKKKFYYQALKMKKRVKRLETLKTSFKKKLQLITKSQKNSSYSHLSNKMNKSTLNFIESQIINQQKSPNGRRYKLDDKIFALSIYKTSPKAYSFLSNMFALPVKSTLNSLLSKIPFKIQN